MILHQSYTESKLLWFTSASQWSQEIISIILPLRLPLPHPFGICACISAHWCANFSAHGIIAWGPAPHRHTPGRGLPFRRLSFQKGLGKKKNYRIENWNSEELWDYRHFQRIENTWWAENGDAFVCRSLSRRLSGRSSRFDPWTCQASPCWSAKTEHEDGENMWKPMKNIHQFARYSSNQH